MKFIFTILLFTFILFSNDTLTISQDKDAYLIGKSISYYVDTENESNIENIENKIFTPYTKKILNFGFLKPAYWFKFTLKYTPEMQNKKWWLSIDYPSLDYVDFYTFDDKNNMLFHDKNGDLNEADKKIINHNTILFSLPNQHNKVYTYYIRVETSSSLFVPVKILSNNKLITTTHLNQSLTGIYYGILLILVLYNFITYLYTREKVFILYVAFVISYAIWQLSFDGLGMLYFWENNYWMKEHGIVFFLFTSTLTLIIFSQSLLKSKHNIVKYNKYLLDPIKFITIFGTIASIFMPYKYMIIFGAGLGILVPILLFIAGLIVLKKGYYSIRLFVIGLGVFLIGTILFTLSKFNIIEGYITMKYGQQIASAIEMILLSGALSERMKILQNEYTSKLKNHNKNLQNQVEMTIEEERKKTQMLIKQSHQASMGEMIEQIAHQWRQPLNTLGLLNQDLYFKKQFNNLDDKTFEKIHEQFDTNIQYMSNTIDDFRNYYKSNKEEERYNLDVAIDGVLKIVESMLNHCKIDLKLDLQKNVTVKNVKNELLQVIINIVNNAKDALKQNLSNNKKINIKLTSDTKYAYVTIEDNAGGIKENIISKIFDPYFTTKFSSQGTGIGLYMAKTIVEKNLLGTISVKNQNDGACFTIKLPIS